MGERTSYEPGTFSWVDLQTSDQDAAKSFYSNLLGWDYDDRPAGEGVVYSMAQLRGRHVAAISPLMNDQREQGIPPHWNSYVTVDSADESAARATELGGRVLAEPFDVFTSGRMAAIADPQGGIFMVWEPRDHPGAGLVNVPGALTWNDLTTPDPQAACRFYGDLFGWAFEAMPTGDAPPYLVIKNGERSNGGIMGQPEQLAGAPPFWNVYFVVEDLNQGIERTTALGGSLLAGPISPPAGSFAVMRDPQGAVFSILHAREYDD